ncbi:MAG TPA: hypothetical protein VGK67_06390 [Myxococcales bacterium]|jgi:hypothetical protein
MPRSSALLASILFAAAISQTACGTPANGAGDAGGECIPESAAELCGAANKDCQKIDATDRCGQDRRVDCGLCPSGKVCKANVCGLETHEANCSDRLDEDGDGLTDCADSDCASASVCAPRPPVPCLRQSDCGNVVDEMVTDLCLSGYCKAPGAATYRGDAITSQVGIRLVFGGALTGATKPKTSVVRFVDSRRPDGSQVNCSLLKALGNCKDETTRSRIDDDPGINQIFRSAYALDFSACVGSECVFPSLFATVPQARNFLLYGEAWYGARDLNDPTGNCASVYCLEGQAIDGGNDTFQVTFR